MAGHSKWANIQHRKGAQDKKRAAAFAKLSKEITIAAKLGGGDIDGNPRLRLAVKNARAESMPKDNIQRAIDKGAGGDSGDYFDIRYEGFGQAGVGIIVECSTDNKNRTAGDVRSTFGKNGGNLGETGSVSFGFDQVGEIVFERAIGDEEAVMEAAIEAGAEDVEVEEEVYVIYTARDDFMEVAGNLDAAFPDHEAKSTKLIWKPQNYIEVTGEDAEKLVNLVDALEDLDDVQNVYHSGDIDESALADA
ncbi:YebC/PmpR family DNA-binding transcriptional regulator [Ponticaulis sp.]|uniref:YebC/PmpR family DNA-binding transcriptional regulator n=1 Tax=Ponticaulis sp. TaxID=2020902 RepID=UPI000B690BB4|nr:YebC/PmpR family DNA-binding transcriptional regulator [Ponticaulis sp.]MAI90631.1 YebC/PmpR family DNA-binding transcriptional regulator [Ponticaulis sp.]OUX99144.1 MAG: YebC/PmpR family DNA-binding transcriptional regulator [Hyphomonadaceae bacterium TMED5]|tara:strand:- start:70068 stop:70814 length:747 start_codon:yes stop_codon:yes gene_type:complete